MCNLYLMYYMEAGSEGPGICVNQKSPSISDGLPADSDRPLPPNPLLEEMARHKIDKGDLDMFSTFEEAKRGPSGGRRKGDLDGPSAEEAQGADEAVAEVRMPWVRPDRDDDYRCTAFSVANLTGHHDKVYVTGNADFFSFSSSNFIWENGFSRLRRQGQGREGPPHHPAEVR